MKGLMGSLAVGVMSLLILSGTAYAATLNVPSSYTTLQAAIDAAASGDTVLVAPGEYVQSIRVKAGVAVQSTGGPTVTTIRGDGSRTPGGWMSYTVLVQEIDLVSAAKYTTISGFTITGSQVGVFNLDHSSPTITNNVVTGNAIGIFNYSSSYAAIINNTIADNVDGILSSMSSAPLISGNVITRNTSNGIYNHYESSPTITNNIITYNLYGIFNYYYASPSITNNNIIGSAYGIYNFFSSSPSVTNNVITGSEHGIYNLTFCAPIITYNDITGNVSDIYDEHYSSSTVIYNISSDPLFVNPAVGDYHLQVNSPCIDAGTNNALGLPETDFDGSPRIVDGNGDGIRIVDIGAFEFQTECARTPEVEVTSLSPQYMWPPSRTTKNIVISGRVILPEGCTLLDTGYSMVDEYGIYSAEGKLPLAADGKFTLTLQAESWRDGSDIDGRHYGISFFAEDEVGVGKETVEVLVPHDIRNN